MPLRHKEKTMSVLYARIPDQLYCELKTIASLADLPMRVVAEVILSEKIGYKHPHGAAVQLALRTHKRNGN